MEIGDLATWVGSTATAITGGFTATQLYLLRKTQTETRRLEREGVAVTWHPAIRAASDDGADPKLIWTYEFRAHNPGRFPIRNVNIVVRFPTDVRRVMDDGEPGGPASDMALGLPVLLGGAHHMWTRRFHIPVAARPLLREMSATISFVDADGKQHVNDWKGGSGGA